MSIVIEDTPATRALIDYFEAGRSQRLEDRRKHRRPRFVPSRIRIHQRVTGDWAVGHETSVEAGDHECRSNQWGAISVTASNGKLLGIKPGEFDILEMSEVPQ